MKTTFLATSAILLFFVSTSYSQLSGNFSIGDISSDYLTLQEAVDDLKSQGVSGPVVFNIATGEYEEQISLDTIQGTSSINTITFQSLSGMPEDVIISHNSGPSNNYIINIDTTNHLIFNDLTFTALNTFYAHLINFETNCSDLTFDNCIFNPAATRGWCIFATVPLDNLNVTNCTFNNGSSGVYSRSLGDNYFIDNNEFINQRNEAIDLFRVSDITITNNQIEHTLSGFSYEGISMSVLEKGLVISNNSILIDENGDGISISSYDGDANSFASIHNNTISTSLGSGMEITFSDTIGISFNSISVHDSDVFDNAVSFSQLNPGVDIQNNIFSIMGLGKAMRFSGDPINVDIDYNNYFSTGQDLIDFNFQTILSSLEEWVTISGKDQNSISQNPYFSSNTDLHTNQIFHDGAGIAISGITTDFEGDLRNDPPDIGADEFTPSGTDVGLIFIDGPEAPFNAGTYPLTVEFVNAGGTALSSTTINWEVNGVGQPSVNWTGNLQTAQLATIPLGDIIIEEATEYNVSVWSELPNGVNDDFLLNDTLQISYFSSFSGIYTVGGVAPDFNDFDEVQNALTLGSISGPVTFNTRPGSYEASLHLPEIIGSSSTNTITFQSESGMKDVNLIESDGDFVFRFDGTHYVRLHNLILENTTGDFSSDIMILENCNDDIMITNCDFILPPSNGTAIDNQNSATNDLVIQDCTFTGGDNALEIYNDPFGGIGFRSEDPQQIENGKQLKSSDDDPIDPFADPVIGSGLIVSGSTFTDQDFSAIDIFGQDSVIITGNTITNSSSSSFYIAINVSNNQKDLLISKNNVVLQDGSGIRIRSNANFGFGEDNLFDGEFNFVVGEVLNNFVSVFDGDGMVFSFSDSLNVFHNSVNLYGTNSSDNGIEISDVNINLKNNISSVKSGGYSINSQNSFGGLLDSDYNSFYSTGILGNYDGTDAADLNEWMTVSGQDANSVSALPPVFITDTDLHTEEPILNSAGVALLSVIDDIDGDPRLNPPDIGADEFIGTTIIDVAVIEILYPEAPFDEADYNIDIVVQNVGSEALNNLSIDWIQNGAAQATVQWTGDLGTNDKDTITVSSLYFEETVGYDFEIWTNMPNGQLDNFPANDTIGIENLYTTIGGSYLVGPTNADFDSLEHFQDAFNFGGLHSPLTIDIQDGNYNEQISLTATFNSGIDNPVIIQSENQNAQDVVINFDGAYILMLDALDYVTIRHLTFIAGNSFGSAAIKLEGDNSFISIDNSEFQMGPSNGAAILSNFSNNVEDLTFTNSVITDGDYGISIDGGGDRISVLNNTFINQDVYSIELPGVNEINIVSNNISNTLEYTEAMYLFGIDSLLNIEKNTIVFENAGKGINLFGTGEDLRGKIVNNFISVRNGSGIDLDDVDGLEVWHNSIHIYGNNADENLTVDDNSFNLNVQNNILSNNAGAPVLFFEAINAGTVLDYNAYFTTGSVFAGDLNSNYSNIADWQAASGLDANSINNPPQYISDTDLHLDGNFIAQANPIVGVPDDIDGDLRESPPDFGADEIDCFVDTVPEISLIQGNVNACVGDVVILESNLSDNILWSTDQTSQQISITESGVFFIRYTSPDGCVFNSLSVTINFIADPELSIDPGNILCIGDGAALSVDGAINIDWSTGETSDTINVLPSVDTQYFVTATNSIGCPFEDSVSIQVINAVAPDVVTGLLPVDSVLNYPNPVQLSWLPAANASHYEVFIWRTSQSKPSNPSITTSNINVFRNLSFNESYYWQVVSKNSCFETEGPIQTLTTIGKPDFVIGSYSTPESTLAGNTISLEWEVQNVGNASSGSQQWFDRVYLSSDLDLRAGDDLLLGAFSNVSFLGAGESYIQQQEIQLPEGLTGIYYLFIIADNIDAVCWTTTQCAVLYGNRLVHGPNIDELNNHDNYVFPTITINPPPAPDLAITSVGAPISAFGGDMISISYEGINQGDVGLQNTEWSDYVFLTQSFFPDGLATPIATEVVDDTLFQNESYTRTVQFQIPFEAFGTYYINVQADGSEDVFEYVLEENNITGAEFPIEITLTPPPDLVVDNVDVPAASNSGSTINVAWTVSNVGANRPPDGSWNDKVFISTDSNFDVDNALLLGQRNRVDTNFISNASYAEFLNAELPNGISGNYYIYVFTDADESVFEFTFEDNNVTRSPNPINITLSDPPDLVINTISFPATVNMNDGLKIDWMTENQGTGLITDLWVDAIYLSPTDSFIDSTAIKLGTKSSPSLLAINGSFSQSQSVNTNSLDPGIYYVFVKADDEDNVYEHTNENNNVTGGSSFGTLEVLAPSPTFADLSIQSLNIATVVNSGEEIPVSWTAQNIGIDRTVSSSTWRDVVYLSLDNTLDASDETLRTGRPRINIDPNKGYTDSEEVTIPNNISGSYFIILKIGDDRLLNDTDLTNNVEVIPITVSLTPPPDLVVNSLIAPLSFFAGERINYTYEVENQGVGITPSATWTDKLFLSSSPNLSYNNTELNIHPISTALDVGDTYMIEDSIVIPSYFAGNYYLVAHSDARDDNFENNEEANNIFAIPVTIFPAPESDLVVSNIQMPTTHILGTDLTLSFTLTNEEVNQAFGNLTNNGYLSDNISLERLDDFLFDQHTEYIDLAPGASLSQSITGKIRDILPGDYFGLVEGNALASINENDFQNNLGVSATTTEIIIPEVQIDIVENNILNLGDLLYYQVTVGSDLDMIIDLTSNEIIGTNEVFVSFEAIPDPNNFDFMSNDPATDQRVLVPQTQGGTYYILIQTQTDLATDQNVDLLVQTLPFSILASDPNVLGQGTVTTTITGAGFRDGTQFRLESGGASFALGTVQNLENSMEADVFWDLTNVPEGTYDLVAENPDGAIVMLNDGITVEVSSGYQIGFFELGPSTIRINRSAILEFTIANTGNIDIEYAPAELYWNNPAHALDFEVSENVLTNDVYFDEELPLEYYFFQDNGAQVFPFLIKNLSPGEEATIKINYAGFLGATFSVDMDINAYTAAEFIQRKIGASESLRQQIFAFRDELDLNPDLQFDKSTWRISTVDELLDHNVISPVDTAGVDLTCPTCVAGNGFINDPSLFDYSPGEGPSQLNVGNINLNAGEDYLWEINKYEGLPGQNPGWDLIQSTGTVMINSSPADPFQINVSSLNYDNLRSILAGWYPAVDKCWPIIIANQGIQNFDASNFELDLSLFSFYNQLHGGHFELQLLDSPTADTIMLCFIAYVPGPGEDGVPGAPGVPGEDGSPGGKGGPSMAGTPAGKGGKGGQGGNGIEGRNAGNGGKGGEGGDGIGGEDGGEGGEGGEGGIGFIGLPGGIGGTGGDGGTSDTGSGGKGGDGGQGGSGGMPSPPPPGGPLVINNPFVTPDPPGTQPPVPQPPGPGGGGGAGGQGGGGPNPGGNGNDGGPGDPGMDDDPGQPASECFSLSAILCNKTARSAINCVATLAGFLDLAGSAKKAAETAEGFARLGKFLLDDNTAGSAARVGDFTTAAGVGSTAFGLRQSCFSPADPTDTETRVGCAIESAGCAVAVGAAVATGGAAAPLLLSCAGTLNCAYQGLCHFLAGSCDPNEIVGPDGYLDVDSTRWVSANEFLPYTIYFENDPEFANAPAQTVTIRQPLDPNVNALSLNLGSFGFANMEFEIPEGLSNYSTVLEVSDSLGVNVEVTAGVDIVNNEVFWVFRAIDAQSGIQPYDPDLGLLPVNDSLGMGEGFVNYIILPKSSVQTGDFINAQASIIFDINEPVITNNWGNVIDAVAPTSNLTATVLQDGVSVDLNWTAQDDPGGVGVKDYVILVSINDGPFEVILSEFEGSSFVWMDGMNGNTYGFISIARDSVDNVEPEKLIADAEITLGDCDADSDDDGVCDDEDQCPGKDDALIGEPCDDGNDCTEGEMYDNMCNCSGGTPLDDDDEDGVCNIEDQCPGQDDNLIGQPCDDGNDCTEGEMFDNMCNCSGGTPLDDDDEDGVCNIEDQCPGQDDNLIGEPCDDGNDCTEGEMFDNMCNCSGGTPVDDDDEDGVCNAEDQCPGQNDALIGEPCDDGLTYTENDVYTVNCICQGTIVPTMICSQIADGNDDVEQNGINGTIHFPSSDLDMTNGASRGIQTIGLRFTDIMVPAGSQILNAYLQFTSEEVQTDYCMLTIEGQADQDASPFVGTINNVSDRIRTNADISWEVPAWSSIGLSGLDQQSPDISNIIQEILDTDGYAAGNAMAIVITGIGDRTAFSYEGSASQAPMLCIEYLACFETGLACDDGDPCTINDVEDGDCNCTGTDSGDSDDDGVCDAFDICQGGDDNIDENENGIPDACEEDCVESHIDTSNPVIVNDKFVMDFIITNGSVPAGNMINYQASQFIELVPEFEVMLGTEFELNIGDCPELLPGVPEINLFRINNKK